MAWTKSHPLERVVEWGAPIALALAAGWSAQLTGLPLATMAASSILALTVGVLAMRMAGRAPEPGAACFDPLNYEPGEINGELLLDDPLVEIASDSRVVQLFEHREATPGELILRISDFLNDGSQVTAPQTVPIEQPYPDASAALHAALANIRASLR